MDQAIWTTQMVRKQAIANQIVELRLVKPTGFGYQAGQFAQFLIPKDNQKILRSYSLASHPLNSELELCVKLLPGGVGSTFFEAVTPETVIRFHGPHGRFINSKPLNRLFCVATGAGLAPIMGIIADELLNKKNTEPIELLFGVRHEADIFWTDRLDKLQNEYPNFTYRLTLSRGLEESWPGLSGRVSAHLSGAPVNADYFICGSAEMVKDVRELLVKQGVPAQNIHFEIF